MTNHRKSSSHQQRFSHHTLESLLSRQLLKVVGIFFLGASLWFAANSTDTLFRIAKTLISPTQLITTPGEQLQPAVRQSGTVLSQKPSGGSVFFFVLCLTAILTGWLGLQLLSRWRKRAEFQIISVFLIFIALLAVIRSFEWYPWITFPFLILIAGGLFWFGRNLSHTGMRIHFLFTWGLFGLWWLLKIMLIPASGNLLQIYVLSSLIFCSFHIILLFGGFKGRKLITRYYETGAIGFNLLIYFVLMAMTILKFHGGSAVFFFALSLAILYIATLYLMAWSDRPFPKTPFLISALALISVLLPLLFRQNKIILLAGSLSVLLMFYSRQTKNQPSILVSLGLVALMVLVFTKDFVFNYIRSAFLGGLLDNSWLFFKGLVAGIFITGVVYTDRVMLKNLEIEYSRKWFSRKRYLTLLKGLFLAGSYFVFFWFWQYLSFSLVHSEQVLYISWFSFHCLYFLIALPWLAGQKSSFLKVAILAGTILTIAYPTLLTLTNTDLLDLYVRRLPEGLTIFPLHYVTAILFLAFISVVLRYSGRGFKGSAIARRIFLVYAVIMVAFILISEMILTVIALKATSQLHSLELRTILLRIPTTLVLFAAGLILLAWGFLKQKRFGRTLAMILLFAAAGKLIYYDLPAISLLSRVILLFVAGSAFIGLSLGYSRAKKTFRRKNVHRVHSGRMKFTKTETDGIVMNRDDDSIQNS